MHVPKRLRRALEPLLSPLLKRRQLAHLGRLAQAAGATLERTSQYVAVRRGDREIRVSRENFVYAHDMIENFDYYFDVVLPREEGGRQIVDYSRPALHTMKADGLPFWFPELAESMETTGIYLDKANLQPGQTVLDLGGYAGGATYHFSRAVGPAGRVYAFEPDPRSFDCLEKNVALHRLTNVVLDRRGVWSHSGRVEFQAEGNMGSAVVAAADRSSDTRRWIDVVSLSDFCAEKGIAKVDFVKMDIEGSEAPILAAAGEFLRRHRPALIIEVHRVQGVRTDDAVTRALVACGYEVEVLPQAGLPLPLLFAKP